jgi:hypothetical protein
MSVYEYALFSEVSSVKVPMTISFVSIDSAIR